MVYLCLSQVQQGVMRVALAAQNGDWGGTMLNLAHKGCNILDYVYIVISYFNYSIAVVMEGVRVSH